MEPLLRFEQVNISYNGKPAARDICFSLEQGEILGIVGESGSGKSTILKAAIGLLGSAGAVTKGDIWFREQNLLTLSPKAMRNIRGSEIGMVFQNCGSAFCPIRTVGAQMFEAINAHKPISKADFQLRALDSLERLGFQDGQRILDSYPFALSGGQQQRVGIAAAMLMNPKVLLADEPTSALDALAQKQVMEQMLLLRKLYGTAIILVTHNIGLAQAMADRLLVLKSGEIMEYGPAHKILEHPSHPYTQTLIAAVPRLRRA